MTELILMPSHAERWLHCPASAKEKIFNFFGSLSYGQAVHELGALKADMLLTEDPKQRYKKFQRVIEFEREYRDIINKRGLFLTDKYAAYILNQVNNGCNDYGIETEIDLSFIYPKMQGRPDFYIVHDNIVEIVDLKTSYKEVKVKKNKQLMLYAVGLLRRYDGIKNIILRIFQDKKVYSWEISPEDLNEWYQTQVSAAIDRIIDGGAVGGEWCRECPKLERCKEAPRSIKIRKHR